MAEKPVDIKPAADLNSEIGLLRGQGFTLRWLLYHVLRHEAYHGGQAVLLSLLPGNRATKTNSKD